MRRLKRFVVLAAFSAILLSTAGLMLAGCGGDHHHHHDATDVSLPR